MMETKEICQKLNQFIDEINVGGKHRVSLSLFGDAADRLEELEKHNEAMMKKLCDKEDLVREAEGRFYELEKELDTLKNAKKPEPEWISMEDGKEMPDAISFTGIRHDQFPRLVIVTDENRIVTHWMMLDAPKSKEPTFYEKFLEAFPNNRFRKDDPPAICRNDFFGYMGRCPMKNTENYVDCDVCWNQPYFEPEEGEAE